MSAGAWILILLCSSRGLSSYSRTVIKNLKFWGLPWQSSGHGLVDEDRAGWRIQRGLGFHSHILQHRLLQQPLPALSFHRQWLFSFHHCSERQASPQQDPRMPRIPRRGSGCCPAGEGHPLRAPSYRAALRRVHWESRSAPGDALVEAAGDESCF